MGLKKMSFMPIVAAGLLVTLGACSHDVTRTEAAKTVDISGKWNDSDVRIAANTLTQDAFSASWLKEFQKKNSRKPVIVTGELENYSYEHIRSEPLINALTAALLKSGEVTVLAAGEESKQTNAELRDHKRHNNLSGDSIREKADYELRGEIHSMIDELMNTKVVYYQIDMKLLARESDLTVWKGQTKIKKIIEKPKVAW